MIDKTLTSNHNGNIQSNNKISIETITNPSDYKTFYNVPFQIHKNNPFWIPPFWKEFNDFFNRKNPFWSHSKCKLFVVRKNSKIAGTE